MLYGNNSILALYVFDDNEKLLANLNCLTDSNIYTNDISADSLHTDTYLKVSSEVVSEELLSLLYKKEKDNMTDYQRILNCKNNNQELSYVINNRKDNKNYKLIAIGDIRNEEGTNGRIYYDIPCAKIVKKPDYAFDRCKVTKGDLIFKINPFNDNGDIYKIKIKEI